MRSCRVPLLVLIGPVVLSACLDRAESERKVPPATADVAANFTAVPRAESAAAAVGKKIFLDRALSVNGNQSCATCHGAEWGFTGPNRSINEHGAVYEGSIPGKFGVRKPPSVAYATPSPVFHYEFRTKEYFGGNFWDGRATGLRLGSPTAEQAQGPFLNPVEQALRDEACVVYRVRSASYAAEYRGVYGTAIDEIAFPNDLEALCGKEGNRLALPTEVRDRVGMEYDNIARAIAAYENSEEINAFSSKYDAYLAGNATLTAQERRGLALFQGKAGCTSCHKSEGRRALFTDYSYDNVGVPTNPENPATLRDKNFRDLGLGAFLQANPALAVGGFAGEVGKVKVPTLRNVARKPAGAPKAFMHNGVFKSLEQVVHFYNTRDVLPACGGAVGRAQWGVTCWPPPAVRENMNTTDLGRMGLAPAEEAALVAYLRTLSDGWVGASP